MNYFLISLLVLLMVSCSRSNSEESQEQKQSIHLGAVKTNNRIVIKAGDDMLFDNNSFTVKAGKEVVLTFMNVGNMPKESMGHNFVLLNLGSDTPAFVSAAVSAKSTDYIPANLKNQIIAYTKLLGPKESDQIKFTLSPGTYEFLCSFPGHYGSMNGKVTAIK